VEAEKEIYEKNEDLRGKNSKLDFFWPHAEKELPAEISPAGS